MDRKIIALIIVVLLVIVGVGAYFIYSSSQTPNITVNNSTNLPTTTTYKHNESNHPSHTNVTNNTKTNITSQQAMSIVNKLLKDDGFTDYSASTPHLMKAPNNKMVWHVPVLDSNKKYVWSVDVDAQTGEIYTLY
ncbi:hypothetical protein [Methanobacterium sp. BAmetb5]|uniref:hypothetical protein n=1 Tax=Methanobacterium sp. BAmetb5 TaxID=2025351 RepID=UPI0025D211F5|nr:hypothetical protein [Methanobacterium sp. BAmetb5]